MQKKIDKEFDNFDGYVRLIEGILLGVLDQISISGKWANRVKTRSMIDRKRAMIDNVKKWLKEEGSDIWIGIYARESGISAKQIKNSFKRVIRRSVKYLNIEEKKLPKISSKHNLSTPKVLTKNK